ncbi:MAG: thiamine-phosphate kinase [Candidatus Omnitrophica bacterium]|nr:thiamine-phosphate kinase [Candidatus Omnitrophota bacterium]
MNQLAKLGEFGLIDRLKRFQNLSLRVVKGMGDDAAVLSLDSKHYQLFTTDMIVEGVHFLKGERAFDVGHKALACNISDIAAMGGWATFAVVSLGLPSGTPVQYVEKIYAGMAALAKKFHVSIVGGDTVKADKLTINIALLGEVEKKNLVTRDGAKPGDVIFVTGRLGGSFKSRKHLTFLPRVAEARFLVEAFKPHAMMDISDGLLGDLGHILKASRAGAVLEEKLIPCAKGASLTEALSQGEDFELLFTCSSVKASKLLEYTTKHKAFPFYKVGRIIAQPNKLFLEGKNGLRLVKPRSFTHF